MQRCCRCAQAMAAPPDRGTGGRSNAWPHQPDVTQQQVLREPPRCQPRHALRHRARLRRHSPTRRSFATRVPVQDYETLRPYIDDQRRTRRSGADGGSAGVLRADERFHRHAEIHSDHAVGAGDASRPNRRCSRTCSSAPARRRSRARRSASWAPRSRAVSTPATRSARCPGTSISRCPASVQSRFVVPPEVVEHRRLRSEVPGHPAAGAGGARHHLPGLAEPVDVPAAARHPERPARSAAAVARDGDARRARWTRRAGTRGRHAPAEGRSRARGVAARRSRPLTFANVWPDIRLVTTWTGGSCGIALDTLRRKLPREATVMELGYQSTEFRGTIALEAGNAGRPAAAAPSFLRVRGAGDVGQRPCREFLHARPARGRPALLHPGHDRVRPVPLFHERPGRGHGVLPSHAAPALRSEGQGRHQPDRRKALRGARPSRPCGDDRPGTASRSSFFLLVADEDTSAYQPLRRVGRWRPARMRGEFAAAVDRRLGELNIEYHGKRASGRLGPLTIAWLKHGAAEAYKSGLRRGGPARRSVQAGGPAVSQRT